MHQNAWRPALALCPNLAYLAMIVEQGSFAAAAAELRMTPSTLSRAIRRLEHELGLELAVPHGRSVELTTPGMFLARHARIALEQMRSGLRDAVLASSRLVIRIGLLRSLGSEYVPTVVGDYIAHRPDVQFSFREAGGTDLETMLLDREIDIALVAPPPRHDGIAATVLFEQSIDIVVAPDSPLARRPSIDLSTLADESFILSVSGYDTRAVADNLFESAGFRPKVILETDDMAMSVALAAAKVGIALAPPTPEALGEVIRVPLNDPRARRHVAVCHLIGAALAPHIADFLNHLIAHPASSPGQTTID
jgi:DNA-binding transcriptional LysR family regulator